MKDVKEALYNHWKGAPVKPSEKAVAEIKKNVDLFKTTYKWVMRNPRQK